ncbi:MAG: insulinase family protein [Phycisphaerales bacterium]|nr:insulinase family protein [Phycisphaerales bacterium]MCB9854060.1 insulinase family protein [Phycisphaerales bacterium]MCB9864370.1 insulinase family protein [Phycisphaerales bacterium]
MLTESYRIVNEADTRVVRYSNGLTAILARHGAAPTAAVRIYVRGGSVLEGKHSGTGISHLFEHLITCDGAGPYSEEDLLRLADDLGGLVNAYTTTDHICYHANVSADRTRDAIDMLAQYVVAPKMSRAVFQRELGVVQRELERDRDDPETQLEELVQELLFEGHPHAAPVIGYRDRLLSLTYEDLLAYHARVHSGENVVIVIAGDIDVETIADDVATIFAGLVRGLRIDGSLADPLPLVAPRRVTKPMDVESASMTMAFPTVRERHPADAPLDLLASILLDGDDARLIKRVRWDDELVFEIGGTHDSAWYAPGSLQISTQCDPENIDRVEAAILDELSALESRPVTARELDRAKRQNLTTILYHRETAEGFATQMGEDYLATGDIAYCEAYLERIRSVTIDEVMAAARRYLLQKPFVSGRIVPREVEAIGGASQRRARANELKRAKTSGGLTLLARSIPDSAFVAVSTTFVGGVVAENESANGRFNALGSIWTRGSQTQSADELAAAFAERGASLHATSGLNQFGLSFVALAEDFDALWPLYRDVLLQPALTDVEWNKVRPAILDAIARQDESWHTELVRFAREKMFETSPYRMNRAGTQTSVAAIDARSIREIYAAFARPGNAVLSIAGGIATDEILPRVCADLGNWNIDGERWRCNPPTSDVGAVRVRDRLFVKESSGDREVAGVFIGFPGLSYADRGDRAAVAIFDTILAGYALASGRLYQALRGGANDLAYEVAGIGFSGLLPGYLAYSSGCEPGSVNDVYRAMRAQIDAIRAGNFEPDEVHRAKAMIRTGELDNLQSAAEIAVRSSVDEVLGLGAEDWRSFLDEVERTSIETVREAAKRYLTQATIVVATPEPESVSIGL